MTYKTGNTEYSAQIPPEWDTAVAVKKESLFEGIIVISMEDALEGLFPIKG